MRRLYIAGPYSADNVITVLNNMRKGMRISTEAFLAGFAPFCPWLDYQYTLMLREGESLTVPDYYGYSNAWLEVSDGILLIEGWENSKGALAEKVLAEKLGIPVFYRLEDVVEHFKPVRDGNG